MTRMPASRSFCWLGLVFALLAILSGPVQAEPPQRLNVQGVVRDTAGNPATGTFSIRFGLYSAQIGGTEYWAEIVQGVQVTQGVFAAVLGNDVASPLPAGLFVSHPDIWLGIRVEAEAELPRQRLVSVPFALESQHADEADLAFGLDCDGCITVGQLGFDPATQTELDALRTNPLAGLSCTAGYLLVFNGTQWVCSGDYVTQAQLSPFVTETELGTALDPYATDAEVAAAIAALGQTLGQTTCTIGFTLVFDGTNWQCAGGFASPADVAALQDDVSALQADMAALQDELTDTQADLGTLQTQVATLQDDFAAHAADPTAHMALFDCAAGEVVAWDGTQWACSTVAAPALPDEPCNGTWQALQWDGTQFQCVDIRDLGLSNGHAVGWEITDSWGYAWDGLMRAARTWTDAKAECEAEGGRLPTVTELYRVNSSTTGSGEVGDPNSADYLWSIISRSSANYFSVRLSDGGITYYAGTTARPFRCVWPDRTVAYFDGNQCFGPAGDECYPMTAEGGRYNIDKYDRPALNFNGALRECEFYHAHLALELSYAEAIQSGLPNGSNTWVFTADQQRYDYVGVVKWTNTNPNFADAYPNDATWADTGLTTLYRFRCIGVDYASGPHPAAVTNQWTDNNQTYLKSTTADETGAVFIGAVDTCVNRGGHLPRQRDYAELIQAGLTNGSNAWLWTSDMETGGLYAGLIRWNGAAPDAFDNTHSTYSNWANRNATTAYGYRCVYYPADTQYHGPATGTCNVNCFELPLNTSIGTKIWVDTHDRSPSVTYPQAVRNCYSLGGHLASHRDMAELIRHGLPNGSNQWVWTSDTVQYDQVKTVKWNGTYTAWADINGTDSSDVVRNGAQTRPYRCVWTNELTW